METAAASALAADPSNPHLAAWTWLEIRAVSSLLGERRAEAVAHMGVGAAMLTDLPPSAPAPFLALWPLVASLVDDPRAAALRDEARSSYLAVNRTNRGIVAYADAVAAGRGGERDRAVALADAGRGDLAHDHVWGPMALRLLAEAALADGWGDPMRWLVQAEAALANHGDGSMSRACHALRAQQRNALRSARMTEREAEVLGLVVGGLSNKEIAAALGVSPRTVEKHVEALLRKASARSRTQLVAVALHDRIAPT
jgi:DNA-binding CsgD family transcriptional regulator